MKDKEKIQCWCNNPGCGKELEQNHMGVCPHCGESAGKNCNPVSETVLGFAENSNDKVPLKLKNSLDKDIPIPKTEQPQKYLEQYCRMKRWYQRFQELNQGKQHNRASDFFRDDVYAFFQNCYHLKDWIINDESVPVIITEKKKIVEKYINCNDCLRWCGDICNGSKHLRRNRTSRSEKGIKNGLKQHTHLHVGDKDIIVVNYTVIAENGIEKDPFELATNCVKAWETFILDNSSKTIPGLLPSNQLNSGDIQDVTIYVPTAKTSLETYPPRVNIKKEIS